jgi:hypothetical protein
VRAFLASWLRVVGGAAFARALPVWAAVAVLAAVVMGGSGMHPASVTEAALGSPRFAAGLALTWLVLIAPVGRAMLDPAPTAWLRALPVAPRWRGAATAAVALAVQLPWAALWAAGAGPAAGALAAAAAAAVMLGLAGLAGRVAWPVRTPSWRGRLAALLGVHRRLLVRGRGAALVRAAGLAWLGGAVAGLVARASQLAAGEAVWWGLAIGAVVVPVATGALAAPVVEADRRLGWVLATSGCSWPARIGAAGLVLAGLGAGLGLVMAAGAWGVGGLAAAPAARLAGWLALLGAGAGGLALRAGAWAVAGDDGTRVVVGMLAVALAALGAIGLLGPVAALALVAAGGAAVAGLAGARPEAGR